MGSLLLFAIALILMTGCLVLVFMPAFPSLPVMFTIALAFALGDKAHHLSFTQVMILLVITGTSLLVDYLAGILKVKYGGLGFKPLLYGLCGLIVGLMLMPPFGAILGLMTGLLLAEILAIKEHNQNVKLSFSTLINVVVGMMIQLSLAFVFIVLFSGFVLTS